MSAEQAWQQAQAGWQTYARTLAQLDQHIDRQQWLAVLALIAHCSGKVAVTGVGTSGIAARKIAHMFSCIECPAVYLNATDAAHGDIGFLTADDLLIMLSRGGNSDELTRLLPVVKSKGTRLVVVTENPASALALNADQLLLMPESQEIDPLSMLATTSIITVLALFDTMMTALMTQNGFDQATLLAVHPGGNVGKQLREGKGDL
ncbi:SIS domain-containing protein [Erwiniaceae bacterium BAC15a-03b]|uniref:SIS domain-containing protein n=1 Tax=Winslowiella arboricola TaxID=2978220 RepID=A0A9J6PN30_9GAMM|nr:SIS domain-containing protein [Winslowiella arboricola]MCU5772813.1 SIS domain-containing protein [Winslowiella arboricola]MCU5777117.1 SIS domain-containing protein [Winslowiella arboricola]